MERVSRWAVIVLMTLLLLQTGCEGKPDPASEQQTFSGGETPEELYEKALNEDVLVVYTVSTRVVQTKEAFEAAYPGLSVEIRDLRSPNLIEAVIENEENGLGECDVVLCNDNSGDFKAKLVNTGFVVPYLPADIAPHMKAGMGGEIVSFLNEAELLFYNSAKYESCPVKNIWELTQDCYRGRIYMPNPLRSFSTYAFCASSFAHEQELIDAYRALNGTEPDIPEGSSAAALFWTMLSENTVFTNSSDEVVEALDSGNADFGIAVSSKLRLNDVGYHLAPVYHLEPFCGCRISFAVMLAKSARNVNAAKLFVRFLLGETDGTGEGYKPFCTAGTWSAREDVPNGDSVSQEEIDLIVPDQDYLIAQKQNMEEFWSSLIKDATWDQ
ncbi:MAG: extracellular solute-binding protein [Lachnospiraceae bacterium]|nr:extracellular solute-binding protein [Lachnospiraceae bacterium]